jgi:hypothetical protein
MRSEAQRRAAESGDERLPFFAKLRDFSNFAGRAKKVHKA